MKKTGLTIKKLVIIGKVLPEPKSTAAGNRILQLIRIFEDSGYEISFLSAAKETEFSEEIEFQKVQMNSSEFDLKIKDLNPDLVIFDRFTTEEQFGWRVSEQCPAAVRILDTEDLHFLREARKKAFLLQTDLKDSDLISDLFKRELASILRCDISLIISEVEMNLLVEKFKIDPAILHYIPFLTEDITLETPGFENRNHFLSMGNFLHEPNWHTVLQLKKIWPKIRKQLPNAELHVYGAYPSQKVYQLHNEKDGFLVKGRAPDAAEMFISHKVLLAPIPFGAGLKGKLWESMMYGLPTVTSAVGAEGMHGHLPWNGFIVDNDEDFADKAVLLYTDQQIWEQAQQSGTKILEKKFKKSSFDGKMVTEIEMIQRNLSEHRNRNFLGQILQHHSLNSTKFMSRWIEEKNKASKN